MPVSVVLGRSVVSFLAAFFVFFFAVMRLYRVCRQRYPLFVHPFARCTASKPADIVSWTCRSFILYSYSSLPVWYSYSRYDTSAVVALYIFVKATD